MKVIIGLGNPGRQYERTPHNAGFICIDKLCNHFDIDPANFKEKKSLGSMIFEYNFKGDKIILAKPTAFMNDSGRSVIAMIKYYKIDIKDIIVAHDDADIEAGKIKIAFSSRAAGHKGVSSIIENLGTKDFKRIRIGIKMPILEKINLEKFVLQKLNKKDFSLIEKGIDLAAHNILDLI